MALLAGPSAKLIFMLAAAVSVVLALVVMIHQHDQRVLAEATVQQQAAAMVELQAERDRTVSALETRASQAEDQARKAQQIKADVHAQPITKGCLASPAITVELRDRAARAGAASGADTGKPANLPTRARAARDEKRR